VPIETIIERVLSGRAKIKDYEAGMDLKLASDHVESFKIFQSMILDEYKLVADEYGLTEIDATLSIGEQQRIVREYLDETLADYVPPVEQESVA
jgi:dTMP kinase